MLNRLQVFTAEGRLLMAVAVSASCRTVFSANRPDHDKQNRLFTSEQLLGRVQMYRYFTDGEARPSEASRRRFEKKAAERKTQGDPAAAVTPQPAGERRRARAPLRSRHEAADPPAPAQTEGARPRVKDSAVEVEPPASLPPDQAKCGVGDHRNVR